MKSLLFAVLATLGLVLWAPIASAQLLLTGVGAPHGGGGSGTWTHVAWNGAASVSGTTSKVANIVTGSSAAGDCLVATVTFYPTASLPTSVSAGTSGAFTLVDAGDASSQTATYVHANITGGDTQVTASWSAARSYILLVDEYHNSAGTCAGVDGTAHSLIDNQTASLTPSSASITGTSGDMIYSDILDYASTTSDTIVAGSGYSAETGANQGYTAVAAYSTTYRFQLVSEDKLTYAGGSVSAGYTFGTSQQFDAAIIALKHN